MNRLLFAAVAAAASLTWAAAQAAVVDITGTASAGTFKSFKDPSASGGVHGLELRGGIVGAGDWEIGLGESTSQTGRFDEAHYLWSLPTEWNFEYIYSTGTSEFRIWEMGESKPTDAIVSYDGLKTGNALSIVAKRQASIFVEMLDGMAINTTIGDATDTDTNAVLYFGEDLTDGFTMSGKVSVLDGGRSSHEVLIKAGNVTPVPVPAALPLLLAALGGMGFVARRRRG